jgi:MtN3 and saliva related transmembrane protein
MFLIFSAGVLLWEIYGLLLGSWSIIVSNVVTLALSGTILVLKVRHG